MGILYYYIIILLWNPMIKLTPDIWSSWGQIAETSLLANLTNPLVTMAITKTLIPYSSYTNFEITQWLKSERQMNS